MSHLRYQYVSGKSRKIAFKLHLFKGAVKEKVHWLRSLLYPERASTMLKNAPYRPLFVFGEDRSFVRTCCAWAPIFGAKTAHRENWVCTWVCSSVWAQKGGNESLS